MNEISPLLMQAKSTFDLPTPVLVLDLPKLERNARQMRKRTRELGVTLRPHVKTSKSFDVLKVLSGGEEIPITVSTLAEAHYFFSKGVRDILYAVGIAPVKLPHVAGLIQAGCRFQVILDSLDAADAVRAFGKSEGLTIEALIEIDTDGHRAGIAPDDELLLEVAQRLTSGPGAALSGVMTHAGASYSARTLGEFEDIAERERQGAVGAADRLRCAGFPIESVSVGSTPTVHYARSLDGVTEARVGVYAFGDLVQAELGTCSMDDIAIFVLTSVIGHSKAHGRVLTDAGFLALSRDRGTADFPVDWGYGAVCDAKSGALIEGVRVDSTNQEHGIITARTGELDWSRFPIGSQVRILPNHACATAAAYDRYFVTNGDERIIDVWERVNGW
ncbi:MAG TPA: alanine racemase [Sphingomicrobium sp.]|jgi:D-serine deaminase-like pyridoxal phosphate-dependent protein|nr:alanine racemase [Sphingomicrobium sp.]